MAIIDNKMLLMRVAREYYLEGLSQQEIARKENLHRTQVSRALKNAREQGFVKIEIVRPKYYENEEIEKNIANAFGLNRVCVAPSKEKEQMDFYFFAAECLEEILNSRKKVGIGWGNTVYQVASNIYYQVPPEPIEFYAVSGISGTSKAHLQTNSIVNTFAQSFHGTGYYNNLYPYLEKNNISNLDMCRYKKTKELWKQLDTVVMSVGGAFTVDSVYYEELPSIELLKNVYNIPHGELLGHIFLENHKIYSLGDNYLVTSIPLTILRQIPDVICIAKGSQKLHSIISAAKQGYINTLITDMNTAQELLKAMHIE